MSPSGVQTLADTRGQYTARVGTLVYVCEVLETEDGFAGDPRLDFLD